MEGQVQGGRGGGKGQVQDDFRFLVASLGKHTYFDDSSDEDFRFPMASLGKQTYFDDSSEEE